MHSCQPLHACRGGAEDEEYGQPQEAAVWDLLCLLFVNRTAADSGFVEACAL